MYDFELDNTVKRIVFARPIILLITIIAFVYFSYSCLSEPKKYYTQPEGIALAIIVFGILGWLFTSVQKTMLMKYTQIENEDFRMRWSLFFN